jgi:hypothetical protein
MQKLNGTIISKLTPATLVGDYKVFTEPFGDIYFSIKEDKIILQIQPSAKIIRKKALVIQINFKSTCFENKRKIILDQYNNLIEKDNLYREKKFLEKCLEK